MPINILVDVASTTMNINTYVEPMKYSVFLVGLFLGEILFAVINLKFTVIILQYDVISLQNEHLQSKKMHLK